MLKLLPFTITRSHFVLHFRLIFVYFFIFQLVILLKKLPADVKIFIISAQFTYMFV